MAYVTAIFWASSSPASPPWLDLAQEASKFICERTLCEQVLAKESAQVCM